MALEPCQNLVFNSSESVVSPVRASCLVEAQSLMRICPKICVCKTNRVQHGANLGNVATNNGWYSETRACPAE